MFAIIAVNHNLLFAISESIALQKKAPPCRHRHLIQASTFSFCSFWRSEKSEHFASSRPLSLFLCVGFSTSFDHQEKRRKKHTSDYWDVTQARALPSLHPRLLSFCESCELAWQQTREMVKLWLKEKPHKKKEWESSCLSWTFLSPLNKLQRARMPMRWGIHSFSRLRWRQTFQCTRDAVFCQQLKWHKQRQSERRINAFFSSTSQVEQR